MKRRLLVLALCASALLAVRMMAQDSGGNTMGGGDASGGATGAENSGASGGANGTGGTGGEGANGGTTEGTSQPAGGMGDQNGSGTGTTPGASGLFGPGTSTGGTGGGVEPMPTPSVPAWEVVPGASPSPAPSPSAGKPINGATQAATPAAPVTLTLPGGYGGSPSKTFTLGEGRLAKPPITFTFSVSQGYDDNIYSADANPVATPTPVPQPTPPLEERRIGFRISPPSPPTPVFQIFRPKALPVQSGTNPKPLGVIGSAESTATLGMQIQKGTPRTVVTMDATVGSQYYWEQPGQKEDYTAGLDMSFVHRLSPRATVSFDMSAVYQKAPNYTLINAPTNNNNNSNYLNGSGM